MKIQMFFPEWYGLTQSLQSALSSRDNQAIITDFNKILPSLEKNINTQMFRFPDRVRKIWERYYFKRINNWYKKEIIAYNPDIVFVYNNQFLHPELAKWLIKRKIKLAFFLGDSPLFTFTSRYNMAILEYADAIFAPDTYWIEQILNMGIKNTHFLIPPLPEKYYFPIKNINTSQNTHCYDVLYIGMSYNNSWGYKKAKFLSHFTGTELKIIGNSSWKRWFPFFPELEPHFKEKKTFIPVEDMNKLYNKTKILPVDGNPGIINGMHYRVMEALSAGTLPLIEYKKDIDFVFQGLSDLPCVKNYGEIRNLINFYLNNVNARESKVKEMRTVFSEKYSNEVVANIIQKALKL